MSTPSTTTHRSERNDNPPDAVDFIIAYEEGECSHSEIIAGFQRLINEGIISGLQGHYQRTAQALISGGHCSPRRAA